LIGYLMDNRRRRKSLSKRRGPQRRAWG
jgi:hypothetical protein